MSKKLNCDKFVDYCGSNVNNSKIHMPVFCAFFLEKITIFTIKLLEKHFFTNSRFTVFLHSKCFLKP